MEREPPPVRRERSSESTRSEPSIKEEVETVEFQVLTSFSNTYKVVCIIYTLLSIPLGGAQARSRRRIVSEAFVSRDHPRYTKVMYH